MTVPVQIPVNTYVANGVTTVFPYTFLIIETDDITVMIDGVKQVAGFTVAGEGNQFGGNITITPAPANGKKIILLLDPPLRRVTDYQQFGDWLAENVNPDFDRIWLAMQAQATKNSYALTFPISDGTPPATLPERASFAGKFLVGDAGGNVVPSNGTGNDSALRADLAASSGGANIVTYLQGGAGSVVRELQERLRDQPSAKDFDPTANGIADDLSKINAAIADTIRGPLIVPAADYLVSANPTNTYGVELVGPGRILKAVAGGHQLLNRSGDLYQHIFGLEYLAAFHRRIIDGNGCNILHTGDSTTAGVAVSGQWVPDVLLKNIARARGIYYQVNWNRGQSAKHSGDWQTTYVAGDITNGGNTPHLMIVRWGINDPFYGRTLAQFQASMESCLVTIRTTLGVADCSILLMTPNGISDSANNRDERWNELVGPVLRVLARKYQCAFIDTASILQDMRGGAVNVWLDGAFVHPLDVLNAAIYSKIADAIYPVGLAPAQTNRLQNLSSFDSGSLLASDLVSTYDYGVTIKRATLVDGWPLDGAALTIRQRDGTYALQLNYSFNSGSTDLRWRVGQGASWFAWMGGQQPFQLLTDAATITWDAATSVNAYVTLAGNRTLGLPTNLQNGAELTLRISQDGVGGRTLAYNAAFKWVGGAAPVVTAAASATTVLRWIYFNGTIMEISRSLDVK